MNKITLLICLFFALSIRIVVAQSLQAPAVIAGFESESVYPAAIESMISDPAPLVNTNITDLADKLTMISSPNPFTAATMITCFLPVKGKLILAIQNMIGKTVKTYEETIDQEGTHAIEVTSEHLRPGIYTVRLTLKTNDNMMMKTSRIVCNQ